MRGKWVFVVLFVWPYFFNQQSVEAVPYGYVVTGSASEQRGQKVILHTVDFETKKIIKSTVLLTNRLAPNIVDISQNPREVGLIVMSGSWGEGKSSQMELNLLDLQNMTIKKKTFIGGGREIGGGGSVDVSSQPGVVYGRMEKSIIVSPIRGEENRTNGLACRPSWRHARSGRVF